MIIKFFENDNTLNQNAIGAGVYCFKIGLVDDKIENYLPLYIGESYSMIARCSTHIFQLFYNDPKYFGLTKEYLENSRLELRVEVYESINAENMTYSERDILLKEKELEAIKKEKPLSQLETSDRLRRDREDVVKKALNRLLEQ